MVKIRLQGTIREMKWLCKILEQDKRIKVLEISEPYANKGTNRHFRVYAEVEKEQR